MLALLRSPSSRHLDPPQAVDYFSFDDKGPEHTALSQNPYLLEDQYRRLMPLHLNQRNILTVHFLFFRFQVRRQTWQSHLRFHRNLVLIFALQKQDFWQRRAL